MTAFAEIDANKFVTRQIGRLDPSGFVGPDDEMPTVEAGHTCRKLADNLSRTPPTPAYRLVWLDAAEAPEWIDPRTLDQAKAQAWSRIKASRDVAEVADFTCNGNVYQADRERINGAVTTAILAQLQSQPYSIAWTLSDNTTVTLDGPGMMAVGAALAQQVKSVFNTGVTLRGQVDAATTIAAADAIAWPA